MTMFDDREQAFEGKFAHDQHLAFLVTARRNRLLGEWAAELMMLSPEESEQYAKSVVEADFSEAGDEDVIRKLLADLTGAGIEIDDGGVRTALDAKATAARRQLDGGEKAGR